MFRQNVLIRLRLTTRLLLHRVCANDVTLTPNQTLLYTKHDTDQTAHCYHLSNSSYCTKTF